MKLILPTIAYWNDFEDLICKLFKCKFPHQTVQKYGRNGQYQAGVDVYVSDSGIGIQCKNKDKLAGSNLTDTEIKEEVAKAKNYKGRLQKYIICYTGQRDTYLQDEVNKINEEHEKATPPLFKVELMSWEEISEEIKEFPDLLIDYLTDVLKKVEDIREHYKKVSVMEKAHKALSDILAEFESNPNETPYLDIYSSQLARNFSYLESSLTIQINK